MKGHWTEFGITIFAILIGLMIGKQIAVQLAKRGVPIEAGNGSQIPLPTA